MRKPQFWTAYVLLLLAQLLLSNYVNVLPYMALSILPVMVLCIPIRIGSIAGMVIAFATGMTVDLLSEGVLGLNAAALVPVALLRYPVIRLVFGDELFAREEDFSPRRHGIGKTAMAVFIVQAVFTIIYVRADGAGIRPFWFNFTRVAVSLVVNTALSMACLPNLAPDSRK